MAALILAWTGLALFTRAGQLGSLRPTEEVAIEVSSTVARLFAALVLLLLPAGARRRRLRWVALGLLVLALGGLLFDIQPILGGGRPLSLQTTMYGWLAIRSLGSLLFVVALLPSRPRAPSRWIGILYLSVSAVIASLILYKASVLPALSRVRDLDRLISHGAVNFSELTAWHWGLSVIPLALSLVATVAAAKRVKAERVPVWLLLSMVLLAGSQFDSIFWPSVYNSMVTVSDALRFAFPAAVAVGAILQLQAISRERTRLLKQEREYAAHLEDMNLLKSNVAAVVAHELVAPIAAIRSLANLLDEPEASVAEVRLAIQAEAESLADLVSDVRRAATDASDEFEIHPKVVSVRALISDAANFARTLPGDHFVVEYGALDFHVWADQGRIVQVLRNLLSNAAKFSPSGSSICLRASQQGRSVTIAVEDRGPGIARSEWSTIMEPFSRGSAPPSVPGAGLGLYVARRLLEAHGSSLEIRSGEAGSVFRFDLAITSQPVALQYEEKLATRILVVDDHASFRESLAALLQRRRESGGYEVRGAGSVQEALPHLANADVALVDLSLPDGSGCDIIRALKDVNPSALAIVLTGAVDEVQIAEAVDAGACGILHKASSVDEILDAVHQAASGLQLLSQQELVKLLGVAARKRERDAEQERVVSALTSRERQVLLLISRGATDKEVAEALHISLATARTHVMRILNKLDAHSRLSAVLVAARLGLVEIENEEPVT